MARAGSDRSQEAATPSRSPTSMAVLGAASAAFWGTLAGNWMGAQQPGPELTFQEEVLVS